MLLSLSQQDSVPRLLQSPQRLGGVLRRVRQRLLDGPLDLGDLLRLPIGDIHQLVSRFRHALAQRGSRCFQLAGGLARSVHCLSRVWFGCFAGRLPRIFQQPGRTGQGLGGLAQGVGNIRCGHTHSFGDLLADRLHLGLCPPELRRTLSGPSRRFGGVFRFAGQIALAGSGSLQGFGRAGQFTDLDRQLAPLNIRQLGFGLGQGSTDGLLGLLGSPLSLGSRFRCEVLQRPDGLGHGLLGVGQTRIDRTRQVVGLPSRFGGAVQRFGDRALGDLRVAVRPSGDVGHLPLLLGGLLEGLFQLVQLLDLPSQLLRRAVGLVRAQGLLEHSFQLDQAGDHPLLFGQRLRGTGFEQLGGRFVGGRLGLFQQRLPSRQIVQRLIQLAQSLVDLRLLLDQRLDPPVVPWIARANLVADLPLLVDQFADLLQRRLAVGRQHALSFLDLFQ